MIFRRDISHRMGSTDAIIARKENTCASIFIFVHNKLCIYNNNNNDRLQFSVESE